jgi:hypothetical protein
VAFDRSRLLRGGRSIDQFFFRRVTATGTLTPLVALTPPIRTGGFPLSFTSPIAVLRSGTAVFNYAIENRPRPLHWLGYTRVISPAGALSPARRIPSDTVEPASALVGGGHAALLVWYSDQRQSHFPFDRIGISSETISQSGAPGPVRTLVPDGQVVGSEPELFDNAAINARGHGAVIGNTKRGLVLFTGSV